jgi:hypothetical protein
MSHLRQQLDSPIPRMFASAFVGLWLGGILLIALAIPVSFRSVGEAMSTPTPALAKAIKAVGPASAQQVLHEQISESNRGIFRVWGYIQIAFGAGLFLFLLFGTRIGRTGLAVGMIMLLLALAMGMILVPRIEAISRAVEMYGPAGGDMEQFRWLHQGFTAFEFVVAGLGAVLFGLLARSGRDGSRHWRFNGG